MRRTRFFAVLLGVCLLASMAGCADLTEKLTQQAPSSQSTPKPVEAIAVKVYFGAPDAEHLAAEVNQLNPGPQLMQQAMELLIAGPKNQKYWPVLPASTKVNSVVVKDKTAAVDFSAELRAKKSGGSDQEILAVSAIVYTLTEFPDVEQVQILVEGKKITTLYGHMDLSEPLGRIPGMIKE